MAQHIISVTCLRAYHCIRTVYVCICCFASLLLVCPPLPARQTGLLHEHLPQFRVAPEHRPHLAHRTQRVRDVEAVQEALAQAPGVEADAHIATAATAPPPQPTSGSSTAAREAVVQQRIC